jgi:excinuclease UvrABC nuclease subunit
MKTPKKNSAWKTYRIGIDEIPKGPGCYAVYADSRMIYVGQSSDVRKRFSNHKIDLCRYSEFVQTPWGIFREITVKIRISKKFGDWAMIESRLIKRLTPSMNCLGSIKPRKESAA